MVPQNDSCSGGVGECHRYNISVKLLFFFAAFLTDRFNYGRWYDAICPLARIWQYHFQYPPLNVSAILYIWGKLCSTSGLDSRLNMQIQLPHKVTQCVQQDCLPCSHMAWEWQLVVVMHLRHSHSHINLTKILCMHNSVLVRTEFSHGSTQSFMHLAPWDYSGWSK